MSEMLRKTQEFRSCVCVGAARLSVYLVLGDSWCVHPAGLVFLVNARDARQTLISSGKFIKAIISGLGKRS